MIQTLQLQHVRSHESGIFTFETGVNIIVGPNASGKTNLLEAVHMLHRGRSFRSHDADMIHYTSDWARIDGTVAGDERAVKLKKSPHQKTIEVADVAYQRLPARFLLPVVVFDPSHLLLLHGDPDNRRRYLDDVIVMLDPTYEEHLQKYKRALQQRNKLLKQEHVSPDSMFVWDVQLCEHAGAIIRTRREHLQELTELSGEAYRAISGSEDELIISQDSKLPLNQYADELARKLRDSFELDRMRGFTGSGPHRDDVRFMLNNHDAREAASRGESRSIVLALKLSEIERLSRLSSVQPVFLLDDVFSELDGKRRRTLADALQHYQSFITTTDADLAAAHFSDSNVIPMAT